MKPKGKIGNVFATLDALGSANSKTEAKVLRANAAQEAAETRSKADEAWESIQTKYNLLLKMLVRVLALSSAEVAC